MSNALVRFEILGELYYHRHGRLRPGKSDVFRDSNDEFNRAQFDGWYATLAFLDAIDKIEELQKEVEQLKFDIEEANDHL